jgi:hypothetical protein
MALAAKEAGGPTKEKARMAAPGMATCEVWSGEAGGHTGTFEAASKENQIPVRVESLGHRVAIFAPPEDEVRSKEIIQEIVEGPLSQKAARCLRGPGIPDPVPGVAIPRKMLGHKVLSSLAIKKRAILSGLHHEYRLEQAAV